MRAPLTVVAYYLPQFHPTPLNDELWGPGFTEWTNVRAAKALFSGHLQPRRPTELGYYDLSDVSVQRRQGELAAQFGIDAFCYWFYWYDGARELRLPLDLMLADDRCNRPFCLGWANHPWTTGWAGGGRLIYAMTDGGVPMYERFIDDITPILSDSRYLRFDGRRVLYLYRPLTFDQPARFVDEIRRLAVAAGLGELFIAGETKDVDEARQVVASGYDVAVPLPLRRLFDTPRSTRQRLVRRFEKVRGRPRSLPYSVLADTVVPWLEADPRIAACAVADFDNTPRYGENGIRFDGFSPAAFRTHVDRLFETVTLRTTPQLMFVKSWNEWAESNYLEPDEAFGRELLEALRDGLRR